MWLLIALLGQSSRSTAPLCACVSDLKLINYNLVPSSCAVLPQYGVTAYMHFISHMYTRNSASQIMISA